MQKAMVFLDTPLVMLICFKVATRSHIFVEWRQRTRRVQEQTINKNKNKIKKNRKNKKNKNTYKKNEKNKNKSKKNKRAGVNDRQECDFFFFKYKNRIQLVSSFCRHSFKSYRTDRSKPVP